MIIIKVMFCRRYSNLQA